MVVTRDLTADHSLPVGTQILRVNGTDAPKVLTTLLPYVRADGANDAKRVALLRDYWESQWEAFDIYYPLRFPLQASTFLLTVQRPGQKPASLAVPAMTDGERKVIRKAAGSPGPNDAVFSRRVLATKVEVIRMPSWALSNSKWDWRTWLDAAMDEAVNHHAPELVLDLRGMKGGDDEIGRLILSRLISEPLIIQNYARLVRYQTAPKDVEPYLDTWDKTFLHLGVSAKPFTSTLAHLPAEAWFSLESENSHAGTENISPSKTRYSGQVVVLVDAQNSSATFQSVDAVQENHLGLLLGEPTGGNRRGINGGHSFSCGCHTRRPRWTCHSSVTSRRETSRMQGFGQISSYRQQPKTSLLAGILNCARRRHLSTRRKRTFFFSPARSDWRKGTQEKAF